MVQVGQTTGSMYHQLTRVLLMYHGLYFNSCTLKPEHMHHHQHHPIGRAFYYVLLLPVFIVLTMHIGGQVYFLHQYFEQQAAIKEHHNCGDTTCVYNGISEDQWKEAVIKEVGAEATDSFFMDILHLEYPHKTPEEREDMLFRRSNL